MEAKAHGRAGIAALAGACLCLLVVPAVSSAGYVNYPNFNHTGGLDMNGFAHVADGGLLRLTDGTDQTSSVFTGPQAIDTTQTMKTSFRFSQYDGSGNPGDGFTFAIHRDPRGKDAIGEGGGSLGYGGDDEITNSVAVEFDLYSDDGGFPLNEDHIAILRNGDETDHLAPVAADIFGGDRYAWIDYSAKQKKLSVYLASTSTKPSSPTTSAKVNIAKTVGGKTAHAGFTGATGGEWVTQDILSWKVAN
jgi:hypothetical protein